MDVRHTAVIDRAIAVGSDFKTDFEGPWTDVDDALLELWLKTADHFDDASNPPHDPVQCGRREPVHRPGVTRLEWKNLREEAGLTLRELGDRVGVDQGTISRWESGARWPGDAPEYFSFLRDEAEKFGQTIRMQIFLLQSKRDRWMDNPVYLEFEVRDDHWHAIFKAGGLFDKWRETGSLPVYTPRGAGLLTS